MNYHKGFAGIVVILVVLGLIVLGGAGYVATNPQILQTSTTVETEPVQDDGVQTAPGDHPEEDHEATEGMTQPASQKISIAWRFDVGSEIQGMPSTNVGVVINGTNHPVATFIGSCSEIGANGGIDGKGLLTGELAGAQCWFAGAGNEIGVFAHEDGGVDIMVGELGEGEAGAAMFRGNFNVKTTIPF